MRRREFIRLLGGTAAWPLAARAQQPGKIWRIGFLAHGPVKSYERLFDGLRELGFIEGQNIIVERRFAEGRVERFQEFAREMVQLKADVIIVVTTPAALAVMNETKTIPIVHPAAIDPLGAGLIDSLAHPGRNLTGASILHAELTAKRLDLLKKMAPKILRRRSYGIRLIQQTPVLGESYKLPPVRLMWPFNRMSCGVQRTSR
jgi:putative ABC transport system substrate-binding protein